LIPRTTAKSLVTFFTQHRGSGAENEDGRAIERSLTTMTLRNAWDCAQRGLGVDAATYGLTGGAMSMLGFLRGLFTPDADDMSRVYRSDRYGGEPTRSFGGFNMMEELFGRTSSSHSIELPNWIKTGALALGAMVLLPALSRYAGAGGIPPAPLSIYSTTLTPAQLIPMAWNRGWFKNWGLMAGIIR
jgi:hypothetical protein